MFDLQTVSVMSLWVWFTCYDWFVSKSDLYSVNYFSASMIHMMAWNNETNMLAALTDGKIFVWYYPSAVYVDKDLLPKTVFEKDTR